MQSLANSSSAEDKSKDSSVTIESKALKGVLSAPPSKSVAHRAIMRGAFEGRMRDRKRRRVERYISHA